MRAIVLSLFALPLAACGEMSKIDPQPHISTLNQARPDLPNDADVVSIANEFYADAQARNHALTTDTKDVQMVDSIQGAGADVIGVCVTYTANNVEVYREIELLDSFWSTASLQSKHTLLFHELGHCALDLQHVPEGYGAIMEPIILNDDFAQSNWPTLVNNEFKASPLSLLDVASVDLITRTAE